MDLAPEAPRARVHLDFIEGMRACAALMVILNHTYAQIWLAVANVFPPPALSVLTFSMVTGHLAVSVFICISGFCLMLPIVRGDGTLRGGALQFFKRRARRILPPYYAALFLCLALIATVIGKPTGTLWDVCIVIRPTDLVSHLLLLQHFFGTGRINYSFWSISLEWQIYFLFPLFVVAFRRFGALATTGAALAVGYAIMIGIGPHSERIERSNLHYIGLFAMGMTAAQIAFGSSETIARVRARVPWTAVTLALIAVQVAMMLHWGWHTAMHSWLILDVLSAATAAAMLVAASHGTGGPFRRLFALRPLVWIGTSSYSLYLIHAPLIQIFWQYVIAPLHLVGVPAFALLSFVGLPLMLLAAKLFYRWFEGPFTTSARAPVVSTRTAQ
ncbi:MAG: acyltransferase [Polyangiaceae bacterium]